MAMVALQVGQFGNAVGSATLKLLSEAPHRDGALFHSDGKARAVLVDGETKVVDGILKERGSIFRRENAVVEASGRGNNWALGYHGPRGAGGNALVDRAMEGMRRELEACDAHAGCLVFHSLCGGSGSGVGSKLLEEVAFLPD